VLWGTPISPETAVNTGQWRNQFQVVIAGSNGMCWQWFYDQSRAL